MSARPGIYLDNNATTEALPEVRDEMLAVLDAGALNPSSVHAQGDSARGFLERARSQMAALLRTSPGTVVFTSGATESNQLVLGNLLAGAFDGFRLVTTNTEHSSIREALPELERWGVEVTELPVGSHGRVDPEELRVAIEPERTLVSVQWANNETGVVQPISEIGRVCREEGAVLHSDAAQAAGKIQIDLSDGLVDLVSVSGHKVHGPLGVGALVIGGSIPLRPRFPGGGQEFGARPGTENLPGIVGMGAAFEARRNRMEEVARHTRVLRDDFEARLGETGVVEMIVGAGLPRLPNTSNVCFREVDGEALMLQLERAWVHCSQGSACRSRKPEPSFVLRAMGLSEDEAFRSLRFSFSEFNTEDEVERAVGEIIRIHEKLKTFFTREPVA